MLECMIVGDSIGVGIAHIRKDCVSTAVGGINSWQANQYKENSSIRAKTVIISLGSNDHAGVKTEKELRKLRANTIADRVYWILPAIKPHIQDIVKEVATKHRDTVVPMTKLQPDGVHPTWAGYKELAEKTK